MENIVFFSLKLIHTQKSNIIIPFLFLHHYFNDEITYLRYLVVTQIIYKARDIPSLNSNKTP